MVMARYPAPLVHPVLLISGYIHVSGCHLALLLISQFDISDAKCERGAQTFGPQTINSPNKHTHPQKRPHPPSRFKSESSAILWLSIISNILCDTRATLWHFWGGLWWVAFLGF